MIKVRVGGWVGWRENVKNVQNTSREIRWLCPYVSLNIPLSQKLKLLEIWEFKQFVQI